jgi:hypothetical protein
MTTAIEVGEGSASRPGRSLPPGKIRYPFYRRLGEPQDRSGQVRKISPPPGFEPQTVQPIVSFYTGYATRPTCGVVKSVVFCIDDEGSRFFWNIYILSDSVTSRVKIQKSSVLVKSIGGNQGAEMANYKYVVAMRERIFSREGFKWKRI